MRIDFRLGKKTCTVIYVDFEQEKIAIIDGLPNDMLHRAFGVNESPTWEDFEYFLEEQCPKSRKYAEADHKWFGLVRRL